METTGWKLEVGSWELTAKGARDGRGIEKRGTEKRRGSTGVVWQVERAIARPAGESIGGAEGADVCGLPYARGPLWLSRNRRRPHSREAKDALLRLLQDGDHVASGRRRAHGSRMERRAGAASTRSHAERAHQAPASSSDRRAACTGRSIGRSRLPGYTCAKFAGVSDGPPTCGVCRLHRLKSIGAIHRREFVTRDP